MKQTTTAFPRGGEYGFDGNMTGVAARQDIAMVTTSHGECLLTDVAQTLTG